MITGSLADNTVKSYSLAVQIFDDFRTRFDLSTNWPPTVDVMINFIAYLSSHGYQYSTAKTYLAGVSFYIEAHNWFDPTNSFVIKKMMKGYQRLKPTSDVRAPITLEMLKTFPLALRNVASSKYEALLFSTAFSVAFFGFLRVGEIVVTSKTGDSSKVISISDVKACSNTVEINLRYSKTDQLGKSVTLEFSQCESKQICPVTLLHKFLQQRPKVQGPLFCHYNGLPVTRFQFSAILSKVVQFSSPNAPVVRTHSFRIGASSVSYLQNISESDIREMGRWSDQSSVYKRYIRLDKIKA